MKKLNIVSITFALMFFASSLIAQFEIKVNPLGLLFTSPDLSGEYIISDELSAELVLGLDFGKVAGSSITGEDLKKRGYRVRLVGKYFFGPEDGADRWYTGLYLGPRSNTIENIDEVNNLDFSYTRSAFSAGLTGGFKWVGNSGVVFELGLGLGRAFNNKITFEDPDNGNEEIDGFGIDGFGKAALGYRF